MLKPRRTFTRALMAMLLMALAVAAWTRFAPPAFGGRTSVLVVNGTSMLPRFKSGDLVFVQKAARYPVGTLAAYHAVPFHVVFFHQIVARDGSRYVFKGLNNPAPDPYNPTRSQIVGRFWFMVPGAGRWLAFWRRPLHAALLVAELTLVLAVLTSVRRRKKMGQPAKEGAGPRPQSAFSSAQGAAALLAAVAAGAAAVGIWAFLSPASIEQPNYVNYRQSGRFSYSAATARNVVYPSGRVSTPGPIFSPLVSNATIRFAYHLTVPQGRVLGGTASLEAVLSSSSGWTRRWLLAPPAPFHGAAATVTGNLNVGGLFATITQVQALTKDTTDSYTLSLKPLVQARAVAGTRLLNPVFRPALNFFVQSSWLQLSVPANGTAAGVLHPVSAASAPAPVTVTHTLNLLGEQVAVPALRIAAPLLALLTAAGAGLLLWSEGRRMQRLGRAVQIARQYRGLLVDVDTLPFSPTARSIRVGSIDGLVKLAEQCERMILHTRGEDGQHLYLLENVGESYYCILHDEPLPPPARNKAAAKPTSVQAAPPAS